MLFLAMAWWRGECFAFAHFLMIWFVGGLIVMAVAEVKARQWLKYESHIVRSQ